MNFNVNNRGPSQVQDINSLKLQSLKNNVNNNNFAEMIKEASDSKTKITFSKHASQRITQRNIEINDSLIEKLNMAVAKAKMKGAKDVAVITPSGAFIVNVPNATVVTGMSQMEMKDNIFTNIDSAIIV